ncbi:MAG: hypothetical protein J5898_12155 [Lachnospiraceae bacterium]|nr:hypothetical protein [Lachnospiraceae bacterium]
MRKKEKRSGKMSRQPACYQESKNQINKRDSGIWKAEVMGILAFGIFLSFPLLVDYVVVPGNREEFFWQIRRLGEYRFTLPWFFQKAGMSAQNSWKVFVFLVNLLTAGIVYTTFRDAFAEREESRFFGAFACVLYVAAPYRLHCLYGRVKLDVVLVYGILPLIFRGGKLMIKWFKKENTQKEEWLKICAFGIPAAFFFVYHLVALRCGVFDWNFLTAGSPEELGCGWNYGKLGIGTGNLLGCALWLFLFAKRGKGDSRTGNPEGGRAFVLWLLCAVLGSLQTGGGMLWLIPSSLFGAITASCALEELSREERNEQGNGLMEMTWRGAFWLITCVHLILSAYSLNRVLLEGKEIIRFEETQELDAGNEGIPY